MLIGDRRHRSQGAAREKAPRRYRCPGRQFHRGCEGASERHGSIKVGGVSDGETWAETRLSREYILSRVSHNPETGIFVWVSSPRPGGAGRRAGFVKNKGTRDLAIGRSK